MSDTIDIIALTRYDPVLNCFVLKGPMKKLKCNCHPNSPFHWAHDQRPSIFMQDVAFRAKGVVASTDYKLFGIYSRAHPKIKPSKNKHEL
ncbi:hypothetical protein [Brevundimonas sp.]|jgi:hypothetical protein|uniref:hypothetical protein n=1 Tax=Brevundimonas sp. TaxID=1871086 RepID=UPI003784C1A2